jgi:hypothetical protein
MIDFAPLILLPFDYEDGAPLSVVEPYILLFEIALLVLPRQSLNTRSCALDLAVQEVMCNNLKATMFH